MKVHSQAETVTELTKVCTTTACKTTPIWVKYQSNQYQEVPALTHNKQQTALSLDLKQQLDDSQLYLSQ